MFLFFGVCPLLSRSWPKGHMINISNNFALIAAPSSDSDHLCVTYCIDLSCIWFISEVCAGARRELQETVTGSKNASGGILNICMCAFVWNWELQETQVFKSDFKSVFILSSCRYECSSWRGHGGRYSILNDWSLAATSRILLLIHIAKDCSVSQTYLIKITSQKQCPMYF